MIEQFCSPTATITSAGFLSKKEDYKQNKAYKDQTLFKEEPLGTHKDNSAWEEIRPQEDILASDTYSYSKQ